MRSEVSEHPSGDSELEHRRVDLRRRSRPGDGGADGLRAGEGDVGRGAHLKAEVVPGGDDEHRLGLERELCNGPEPEPTSLVLTLWYSTPRRGHTDVLSPSPMM